MDDRLIWDNDEKTILRQIYSGKVTPDDVLEISRRTYDLLSRVSHTVHLIIETSPHTKSTHQSFVKAARELDQRVAPNQGMVVVVDTSYTSELTLKSMKLTSTEAVRNIHTVKTVAEARAYLAKYIAEQKTK